jgi:hypothetical protein
MPALVAGIHVFLCFRRDKTWMAGTKPGHDALSPVVAARIYFALPVVFLARSTNLSV